MIYRMLVLVAVSCLLAGCSGGETAAEGNPPESSPITEAGPAQSPDPDGGARDAAMDSTESAEGTVSGPKGAPPGASEVADESPGDPADADSPVGGVSAFEIPLESTSASGLRVVRAYVCKGIEQGEPTEAGKSFVPEDGVIRLCCFSEVAGATGPDTVLHIWRWGDREMARVVLEVKSSRWRTWSTKRILDEWRGEWHVDVTDSEGSVLASLGFSVE